MDAARRDKQQSRKYTVEQTPAPLVYPPTRPPPAGLPTVAALSWGLDKLCCALLRAGARLDAALLETDQERRRALLLQAGGILVQQAVPGGRSPPLHLSSHAALLCADAFSARAAAVQLLLHQELLGTPADRDPWLLSGGWRGVHAAAVDTAAALRAVGDAAAASVAEACIGGHAQAAAFGAGAESRFKRGDFVEAWALAAAAATLRPEEYAERASHLAAAAAAVHPGAALPAVAPSAFLPAAAALPPIPFTAV